MSNEENKTPAAPAIPPGCVQAMMRVTGREELNWGGDLGQVHAIKVTLQPVYSGDPTSPNYSWSKASPSGELTLQVDNPNAWPLLRLGAQYLLTFEEVPSVK